MFKEIITYEEYGILLNELVEKIKADCNLRKVKFIYTFVRGGLPIAVHLSHFLNLDVLTDQSDVNFPMYGMDEILVVDDIADTGKTLDGFQRLFPTATLYYKPRSIIKPTYFVRETTKWIVFPWEREDETPNRPE
jgi:hypoxanthine phosphoribosyltransferase